MAIQWTPKASSESLTMPRAREQDPVLWVSEFWQPSSLASSDPMCFLSFFFLFFFFFFLFFFFFGLFAISWATPTAYGGSQARGLIRAVATSLRHSHSNALPKPRLRPTPSAHGNTGSLTYWARPEIKPATSWFLVWFANHWAMAGTPPCAF